MSDTGEEAPRAPKAGRRHGRRSTAAAGEEEAAGGEAPPAAADPSVEVSGGTFEGRDEPPAPPIDDNRNKGWGENVTEDKKFVGISRRKQQQMEQEASEDKTSGLRNRKKHEEAETTETILEIPELEAEGDEDITTQVAEPPRAWNNRMQTMEELNDDQQYNLPSNPDLDIDLSLLTTVLCSSEQVEEDTDIWEPEILFTDVASELTLEAEALENDETEESPVSP
eukprot:CAMPEP_0177783210 /NCGR_PEP_ID=MMETSP0491_2-20121128/18961_1 /TAXON_ID=63592 /ORGANISM="Tetraselmis chuii, Strain PLY429" /LENGTH=224 /DNA_ID=CAMNT_0019303725 /DNA_START=369 /DNA_END=1043 /DNA_ORIENTATION=-